MIHQPWMICCNHSCISAVVLWIAMVGFARAFLSPCKYAIQTISPKRPLSRMGRSHSQCRNYARRRHLGQRRFLSLDALDSQPETAIQDIDHNNNNENLYRQFKDLSIQIRKYDELYYSGDSSPISDDEFDAMVRKEEEMEVKYPKILEAWRRESGLGTLATRSGRVGSPEQKPTEDDDTSPLRLKREHLSPMLSLDNVHNHEQLIAWLKRVVKAATELDGENNNNTKAITIVTEPKLDGLGLSLRYEASSPTVLDSSKERIALDLKWASTRGDGKIGQDVTPAVLQMSGVPSQIHLPLSSGLEKESLAVEVRGEIVLPRSEFLRLKQEAALEETAKKTVSFSNPRNAASGILLRKESVDLEEKEEANELRSLLRFYAYDVSTQDAKEMDGIEIRQQLSDWEFALALPATTTKIEWDSSAMESMLKREDEEASELAVTWDDWFRDTILETQIQPIEDYFQALEEHREDLQREFQNKTIVGTKTKGTKGQHVYEWGDFDVDGCVHKVSQASIKTAMGYSMKSPKWATAHKFPAQSAVSRLIDIVVQMGRTGALTPVAILEPTEVGGVTVQRATLHNFGHLQEILGSKDSVRIPKYEPILLQRAGDVIPQVLRRIHHSDSEESTIENEENDWISLVPPEKCPFCDSPVVSETFTSSAGQVLRCSGPPLLCPPRAVTSLKHAFSRDALDVTGLSESRIQQLMDAGMLKTPADLFRMGDEEWKRVSELPGWGDRSSLNLRKASDLVSSKGIALSRFLYSLGIRHVGKHSSELLAASYGSIDAFWNSLEEAAAAAATVSEDAVSDSGDHPFPALANTLGVGPVMIQSLLAFAKTKDLVDAAKELANLLTILEQEVVLIHTDESTPEGTLEDLPWKGFRVVFTGSLQDGLTRSKAQEIAKQLGAKATPGSVSKNTDLVVFGEKGGKKLTMAQELGLSTMEADAFVRLAKENGLL